LRWAQACCVERKASTKCGRECWTGSNNAKKVTAIITSQGEGSCSECLFARQVGDAICFHRHPESENLVV